jgi:hypothetical protein
MRPLRLLALVAALPPTLLACPNPTSNETNGRLVLGLTAEDLGGAVTNVDIVTRVGGVQTEKQSVPFFGAQPKEVVVEHATANADVEFAVTGSDASGNVVLSRLARVPFPSSNALLRVRLEQRCVLDPPTRAGPASSAPRCTAPQTCIAGRCADSSVLLSDLEPYVPDWATQTPDVCRPANAGAPEVIVGTGQTDYTSLTPGQTLQAELGPQGGHHVWVGVRMKNLKQSGSTTTITGKQPDTNVEVPPTSFVFTFDRDEGGYCKLYGLRYQLDNGAVNLAEDYKRFLGKDLDVTVEVRDTRGTSAKATTRIHVADKVLCPDGTSGTCT